EEFDVNVTFPEQYEPSLAGKDAVFKCKINEIKAKELPELDDEFAKDVSEFDTLDELKADLKKQIADRKAENAKIDFENQILEQVCENMEVEIPECMFTQKCDEMVQDYAYRLQMQGLDLNTYLQYLGQTMDQFKEQFMEGAKQQVKSKLALDAIVKAENIEASEEEIEAEINKLAEQYNMEADKIKAAVPAEQLSADITTRKAVDFIVDNAVKE
ncbi:trigger factor, partial [Eubacterium coprostanoligenes]|uniref:trigger factor n=2 Tax=Eubacterium TaxID=1730 RepID=UPI00235779D3